jgi:hypothetical protein
MNFYTYKILKSSWGVRIGFELEAIVEDTPHLIKITDNVSIDLNAVFLTKRQQWYVIKAFEYISTKIEQPISIRLKQLVYNFTDFQDEGLYCGIVSWAAQTYPFDTPHFDIIFDRKQNVYCFLNIPQYGFKSATM